MVEKKQLVSIIVRTKDRPDLLKRALKSIFSQTHRPLEVVLVNDGGCKLPEEELRQSLGDVSLRYIRLKQNKGRAYAGNVGIENAKGDYVGFLDDDDELYPDHVDTLVVYLDNSEVKIAYTDSLMVYQECDSQTQEKKTVKKELAYSRDFDYSILIFENYIPFMCLLFDRQVLINSGGLDTEFEVYEDYDLLIRLGEKYPFHHIKKTTAHYNLWDNTSQIAQMRDNERFQKESYLRLFSKHIEKFTPERIFHYRAKKYTEITDRDYKITSIEAELEGKSIHIGNLDTFIKEKDTYINNLSDVIKGKDQYIASVVSQLEDIQHLKAELNTIYNSHGWKILKFFYRIRDKILPPDTIRRSVFKRLFHFLVSFPNILLKKKTDIARGELLFHVETDLSKPFVIGEGNALYLRGWCYHTTQRIQRLYILIDDTEYRVFNHSFVRDDIFREHSGTHDPKGYSMNSGFWVIIPFSRIDYQKNVNLHIRAELSGDQACTSSLGILTLDPFVQVKSDKFDVIEELSQEHLVAICLTTYNPPLDHFKRQINSIMSQTHSNWVCIINDDCSEAEIFKKIKNEVAGDKRFRVYTNPFNLGFYYNFEKCLSHVPENVSFIALSDQDDSWSKDKLSTLLKAFDEKTTLVFSDMNIVDEKGEVVHPTYWTTRENNFTELDLLMIANTVTGAASMFRKDLLEFILPFPERVGDAYHDSFIACTALSLGDIHYIDKPLYNYYQHSGNIIGHCVPDREKNENKHQFSINGIKDLFKNIENHLLNYRRVYFNHYITRVLIAHILNLRGKDIEKDKRKIIKRFLSLEKSFYGMIYQVLKDKFQKKWHVTIGVDSQILKGAFANKLINTYYKLDRIFHS